MKKYSKTLAMIFCSRYIHINVSIFLVFSGENSNDTQGDDTRAQMKNIDVS